MDRLNLYQQTHQGRILVTRFCLSNKLVVPEITILLEGDRLSRVHACGWYRHPNHIWIKPWACQWPARGEDRYRWSYPGYLVDRTPVGVLAHELGHHLDYLFRHHRLPSLLSNEKQITGYAISPEERFAEFVKVFVTNPDLLSKVRPRVYEALAARVDPVVRRPWHEVLKDAPQKIIARCERLTKGAV